MNKFKNLQVWKRAVELATGVYEITQAFPNEERYGLTSQIRRSVVSVSSNIAEGAGRGTDKKFNYYLRIAYGSLYELETQLIISRKLNFISKNKWQEVNGEIQQLQKMIYTLSEKLISHSS